MARSVPSVLVVLVARNGASWLRESLEGLSSQTYPRLGVVGVDCGSTDGSRDLLVRALGEDRVREAAGTAGALAAAARLETAAPVDYFLLLHDDAAPAPDAVERLVEAAETVENPGVVGAKLVDWDDPRILRDIGWSADRFGHRYTPLEPGELDQGQYDRIRDVLFVADAAALVSQAALVRAGHLDERLGNYEEELDFCWRVRLAGFRVLMSPLALVRHRDAAARGERTGDRSHEHRRYYEERSAVVAISKNYGLGSIWVLPLFIVQGLAKLVALAFARRLQEAGEMIAAWGWNLLHFPGTVLRRVKIQAVRSVKDHEIHRYMAPGNVRFRRWLDAAGRFLPGDVEVPDEFAEFGETAPTSAPFRERAGVAAKGHPVAAAIVAVAVIAALAFRHLIGRGQLTGGALPAVLPPADGFFSELLSGVRTTALGGAQSASPALGVYGAGAWLPFSSSAFAQKVLLMGLPILAGVSMYRAGLRMTAHRVASLAAAACYVLLPLSMWAFSTGRIPLLAAIAALPKVGERLAMAFGPVPPARRWRFIVGTGVFVAIAVAFYPGIALGIALLVVASFLVPDRAGRRWAGLGLTFGFLLAGAALVFPMIVEVVDAKGRGAVDLVGLPHVDALARFVLVPGKGDWVVSWFLPVAALLCFGLVSGSRRRLAFRHLLAGVAGLGLAWAAAAGWLPANLSDPAAYLAVAAFSACVLIAAGLASILEEERSISVRRLVAVLTMSLLVLGIGLQALLAAWGSWDVGTRKLAAAWPLVATGEQGPFRVLWLADQVGEPFPAPGGDPTAVFAAGPDSLEYAVTDGSGVSALDVGRGQYGPGYDYLEQSLAELLSGKTVHAGALLGSLGIRYVVAASSRLPASVLTALGSQVDIDRVPAIGLAIFRVAPFIPPAAVIDVPEYRGLAGSGPSKVESLPPLAEPATLSPVTGGWDGTGRGLVWVGDQYAPGWQLHAGAVVQDAGRTLGWAMTFDGATGGSFEVRYANQWIRTAEMAGLGLLWLVALWVTRKPAR